MLVWPPLGAILLEAPPGWILLALGAVVLAGIGLFRGRTWGIVTLALIAAGLAVHASGLLDPVGLTWTVAGPASGALQPPAGAEPVVAWRAAFFAGSGALACALAVAPYAAPVWRWLRPSRS